MVNKIYRLFHKFSPKVFWKEILALLIILLAFVFFREQRKELLEIGPMLQQTKKSWLLLGIILTLLYVLFQGLMYLVSFRALGLRISLSIAIELFLKRNFLSVFLPAGGISSLAYSTSQLRKRNLNSLQIHQAGALYGFIGLFTVFVVAIPVLLYSMSREQHLQDAWVSLIILGFVLALVYLLFWSFRKKRLVYRFLEKRMPSFSANLENICSANIRRKYLYYTIWYSLLIECCGILHAYIGMYALGIEHSFEAAVVAYTVSVVLMIVSPFLRGLGAVEFSMLYVFMNFGYHKVEALGITLLYRIFEFWLPLFLGLLAFAWRGQQLLTRIGPALLIFFLGMVNLASVLTPPLAERMRLEKFYINVGTIYTSKLLIIVLGLGLILTAAYLIKGYRSAFWIAISFSALSILGHILKALDYEEAIVSFVVLVLLMLNQKQYRVQSSRKWLQLGFGSFFLVFLAVCTFAAITFYFLDKKHFGQDFTLQQSVLETAGCFLFFLDSDITAKTTFAKEFLLICNVLGILCWLLLFYAFIVPKKYPINNINADARSLAAAMLFRYGRSSLDYFKTAKDKELYFSEIASGFTAYRVANNFAIVLDEPVCDLDDKEDLILEFDAFCRKRGLLPVYYRISENSLVFFQAGKKKKLLIGQEAIVDLHKFSLEGKERKSLRNGLNYLQKNGYEIKLCKAPQSMPLLAELEVLSNDWLMTYDRKEMGFSQGVFDKDALIHHDLLLMRSKEGELVAFLNIIPDYASEECTYDLIRKSALAPGAAIDGLMVQMIQYGKDQGYRFLNIGMVALSGLETADHPVEKIMRFISTKVPTFKLYQSQKEFKEKYTHRWENRYLVFDHDFDLIQLPNVLRKVMKPLSLNSKVKE